MATSYSVSINIVAKSNIDQIVKQLESLNKQFDDFKNLSKVFNKRITDKIKDMSNALNRLGNSIKKLQLANENDGIRKLSKDLNSLLRTLDKYRGKDIRIRIKVDTNINEELNAQIRTFIGMFNRLRMLGRQQIRLKHFYKIGPSGPTRDLVPYTPKLPAKIYPQVSGLPDRIIRETVKALPSAGLKALPGKTNYWYKFYYGIRRQFETAMNKIGGAFAKAIPKIREFARGLDEWLGKAVETVVPNLRRYGKVFLKVLIAPFEAVRGYFDLWRRADKYIRQVAQGLYYISGMFRLLGYTMTMVGSLLSYQLIKVLRSLADATKTEYTAALASTMFITQDVTDATKLMADTFATVRDVAQETGVALQDVAQALYFIGSAGYKNFQVAQDVLRNISIAAFATGAKPSDIFKSLITLMNAYNIELTKSIDVLNSVVTAVAYGVFEMSDLASILQKISSFAELANAPLGEILGTLVGLSQTGIPPQMLRTSFSQFLMDLVKKAPKLEAAGISTKYWTGTTWEQRSPVEIMKQVATLYQSPLARQQLIQSLGLQKRSLSIFEKMLNNLDKIDAGIEAIEQGQQSGILKQFYENMQNTVAYHLNLLKNAFESLKNRLLEVFKNDINNALDKITVFIQKISDWLNEDRNAELLLKIFKQLSLIALSLIALGAIFIAISLAVRTISGVIEIMRPSIMLMAGVVVGLMTQLSEMFSGEKGTAGLIKNLSQLKDMSFEDLMKFFENMDTEVLKSFFDTYMGLTFGFGKKFGENIAESVKRNKETWANEEIPVPIKFVVSGVDLLTSVYETVDDVLDEILKYLETGKADKYQEAIEKLIENIRNLFTTAVNIALKGIKIVIDSLALTVNEIVFGDVDNKLAQAVTKFIIMLAAAFHALRVTPTPGGWLIVLSVILALEIANIISSLKKIEELYSEISVVSIKPVLEKLKKDYSDSYIEDVRANLKNISLYDKNLEWLLKEIHIDKIKSIDEFADEVDRLTQFWKASGMNNKILSEMMIKVSDSLNLLMITFELMNTQGLDFAHALAEAKRILKNMPNAIKKNPAGGGGSETAGFTQFAKGGYTGDGSKYQPAGLVHKGEYVLPAWFVEQYPDIVAQIDRDVKGYAGGGLVNLIRGVFARGIGSINNLRKNIQETALSNLWRRGTNWLQKTLIQPIATEEDTTGLGLPELIADFLGWGLNVGTNTIASDEKIAQLFGFDKELRKPLIEGLSKAEQKVSSIGSLFSKDTWKKWITNIFAFSMGKATGGYTGSGTTFEPAGIVHKGEYVVPQWLVRKYPEIVAQLERIRRRGFNPGGMVDAGVAIEGGGDTETSGLANFKLGYIFDKMVALLETFVGSFTSLAGTLPEFLKEFEILLKAIKNATLDTSANIAETAGIGEEQQREATWDWNAILTRITGGTINPFITGIIQSIGNMQILARQGRGTQEGAIWEVVSGAVVTNLPIFKQLPSFLQQLSQVKDVQGLVELFNAVKDATKESTNQFVDTLKDIAEYVGIEPEFIDNISQGFNTVFTAIEDRIAGVGHMIENTPILSDAFVALMPMFDGLAAALGSSVDPLLEMISGLDLLKQIVNAGTTIAQATFKVLEPILNQLLQPLVGILVVIGQTLGTLLMPILQMLAPVIQFLAAVFAWLANNIVIPIAKLLYRIFAGIRNAFFQLYNFIADIIKALTFGIIQLQKVEVPNIDEEVENMFSEIDVGGLNYLGETAGNGGGGGGSTGVTSQAQNISYTINWTVEFNDAVIADKEELKRLISELAEELNLELGL